MIDEFGNVLPVDPPLEDPSAVVDPEPEAASEPETTPEQLPEEDPTPTMEVVSVDELLERVAAGDAALAGEEDPTEGDPEEMPEEELTEEPETYTEVLEVVQDDTHYFLTTDFADYTVTEGLLLWILIALFLKWIGGAIKEGFYWLW